MKDQKLVAKMKKKLEVIAENEELVDKLLRNLSAKRSAAIKDFFKANDDKLPHLCIEEYIEASIAVDECLKFYIERYESENHSDGEFPELKRFFSEKEKKHILMSQTLGLLKLAIDKNDVPSVVLFGVFLGDQFAEERMEKGNSLKLMQLRKKGTKARQSKAKKAHEQIKKSLDRLYNQGQGFKMTYPQISTFLLERNISEYTEAQTLKLVKKYSPEIKKKYS